MQNDYNINDFEQKPISQKQKIAIGGLVVLSVLIIGGWLLTFKSKFENPLLKKAKENGGEDVCLTGTCDLGDNERTKDTDNDGLLDWDENNIYSTSPYLDDTDSDGISDGVEIANGTDPNCPKGKECFENVEFERELELPFAEQENISQTTNELTTNEPTNLADDSVMQKILSGTSDPDTLRQLLISTGADPSVVNKISDEVLIKSYKEMLDEQTDK